MKKIAALMGLSLAALLIASSPVSAEIGAGSVLPSSPGLNLEIFGSMKTYPHFVSNIDFNDDNTAFDWMLDEGGIIDNDEITIRNEFRLGFKGAGENWDFLAILEADFAMDKDNVDRGARSGELSPDIGMVGDDFGVEKLMFTYDFGPTTLATGWQTTHFDLETGAILYGDDHPFVGLSGEFGDITWETLFLLIYDRAIQPGPGILTGNADEDDWQVYSFKATMPVGNLKIIPIYAYSDNQARSANVHYIGAQALGEFGIITPMAEFIYATGEKDNFPAAGTDADISAYGGFAALQIAFSDFFTPYFGGYYISGDDDATDDDIEAFNPITNISRYSGTFGMENAYIYRFVPVLGTHLYSNTFDTLGFNSPAGDPVGPGYGGISNSASANSPGMYSLGIGTKGVLDKWAYKTQFQYFFLAEAGALEDVIGNSIDDTMGWEFDLQLVYSFNDHFSLGNVISVFDPGDGVQDIRGDDFDELAVVNTVEMFWNF